MSAIISPCGQYRYRLERDCGFGFGSTAVIMVNPSTADGSADDATVRKLRGFGLRRGWGKLIVGNLFAYRATNVRLLGKVSDPVGPDNDTHLAKMAEDADRVVFAWGPLTKQPSQLRARWEHVASIFTARGHRPLMIGSPTKCGQPRHPLMLAYAEPLTPFTLSASPNPNDQGDVA